VVNWQQTRIEISHHTLNTSLHYFVKYECQKTGSNLKDVLRLMINHKVVYIGEVTSQSLWSRYDRYFVGITRYNRLS